MKRHLVFSLLILMTICLLSTTTQAADWIYQRSYYSHDPVQPVRIGPQTAYGGPVYSAPRGAYFSSGLRQLRSTIQVGNSVDNYYQWESWGQHGFQN